MTVCEWILSTTARSILPKDFVVGLAEQLRLAEIPIDCFSFSIRTMHPEVGAEIALWSLDDGAMLSPKPHGNIQTPKYMNSPVAKIAAGDPGFRQQLVLPIAPHDFPVLRDLQAAGYTDYLIEPLPITQQLRAYVSWSTKAQDGFSEAQISSLKSLTPYMTVAVALMSQQSALVGLLETYLGRHAGRLVRSGQYRRGDGTSIEAVIWFSDLRGFTSFTDQHTIAQTLQRLNHTFDVIGKAISDQGGEILKFIGDAVLAVFPIEANRDEKAAARSALLAAQEALKRFREDEIESDHPIQIGIGIHKGTVTFGNVGTTSRLDFTVIGSPVNEAARVEALCKTLNENVLMTEAIANLLPEFSLRSLGKHNLRGMSVDRELFGIR